jgi:hypothetical protein
MFFLSGLTGTTYLSHLMKAIGVVFISWIATVVTVVLVALLMTSLGRRMSWYTHTFNMIGLYVCPAITANVLVHLTAKKYLYKVRL